MECNGVLFSFEVRRKGGIPTGGTNTKGRETDGLVVAGTYGENNAHSVDGCWRCLPTA